LTIRSEPPGATIMVDDEVVGITPYAYDFLWYGWHRISLAKDGYERLDDRVNITSPPALWIPFDFGMELLPMTFRDDRQFAYQLAPVTPLPDPHPPRLQPMKEPMVAHGEQLYEGKAKILYATEDPDLVIQYFKDDATAFNAQKRGTIVDKGVCNNKIASHLFQLLEASGVPTHFVRLLSDREMLVKKLQIVPLEVTIRNITAGGISKLLGIEEGLVLRRPVFEWHYKSDALGDPLINDDHILALSLATEEELETIRQLSFRVNDVLKAYFADRGIDLVDFKLEFGRHHGLLLLGDEISPDTCRFWEQGTQRKLDKDRFRRDLGDVEAAYQEMLRRVVG
jgi:phosphoribosylaminoimidazole-succinocarboxamide synthase